ncbi:MAG: hypothetical protein GC136_09240 [Alphaproteobacteria bacterium]|nr:hypothetical protein [Alphaproteobacteria bacterium]
MKKHYLSSEITKGPYSGAWEANGFVYVSGQIHQNEKGEVIGETIEEKLDLIMTNIKKILAEANLTLADVIRVHVFITDISQLPAMNAAYMTYFNHPLPARTAIGVSALPRGASLEIEAIAVRS